MRTICHCCPDGGRQTVLFYVTGCCGDGSDIRQPAERHRVMHAMERVHDPLEVSPWHQCHVDAAIQVPPSSPQVALATQLGMNGTFIASCNVRTPAARDSGGRPHFYTVHRPQCGLAVARSKVDTGD
jgi:hypothetical protein